MNRQERSVRGCVLRKANLMSSSVTMKALHSGWAVLSHTPGFFSTAADNWPVMGAALVCRALAMADSRVLSVHPGPTPEWPTRQLEETPQKTVSCNSSRTLFKHFKKINHLFCFKDWTESRFTLKAFRQFHCLHQLLCDVICVESAEFLLPEELEAKQDNNVGFRLD